MLAPFPKVNSPLIATVVGVIAYVIIAAAIVYILYLLLQTVIHHK
jgi:preprotein translocase subunit SecE